jgi:DnaJ domain
MTIPRVSDPKALAAMHAEMKARGGLRLRLLICDTCLAVWPTETCPGHVASRQDGEPCAYNYKGKVCAGFVQPMNGRTMPRDPDAPRFTDYEVSLPERPRWYTVLGCPQTATLAEVRTRYRVLCKELHPDLGGTHDDMVKVNVAYAQALAELSQP